MTRNIPYTIDSKNWFMQQCVFLDSHQRTSGSLEAFENNRQNRILISHIPEVFQSCSLRQRFLKLRLFARITDGIGSFSAHSPFVYKPQISNWYFLAISNTVMSTRHCPPLQIFSFLYHEFFPEILRHVTFDHDISSPNTWASYFQTQHSGFYIPESLFCFLLWKLLAPDFFE